MKASELIGHLIKQMHEYGDFHICLQDKKNPESLELIAAYNCMCEGSEILYRDAGESGVVEVDQKAMLFF